MWVESGSLIGCVELGALLRKDGQSQLYEGSHGRLNVDVMVRVAWGAPDEDRERFLRELRVSSQMQHPSVVRAIDFGEYESLRYVVSPRVRGRDLESSIGQQRDPIPEDVIARLLARAAAALRTCHAAGLAHRNLSPSQLYVDARGQLRIAEFGFAAATSESLSSRIADSREPSPYLPPECRPPEAPIPAEADWFALGAIAYELAFQRVPEVGIGMQDGSVDEERASARLDLPTHCSPRLIETIERLIHPEPSARLRQAEDLLERLPEAALERPMPRSRGRAGAAPGSAGDALASPDRTSPQRALDEPDDKVIRLARILHHWFGATASAYADRSVLHTSLRERALVWVLLAVLTLACGLTLTLLR